MPYISITLLVVVVLCLLVAAGASCSHHVPEEDLDSEATSDPCAQMYFLGAVGCVAMAMILLLLLLFQATPL